jgi:nicotinamidase/pyrazinamidase
MPKRALIVVDVQYDFMPDGALPVQGGYDVVPVINELMDRFELVVATQDWHPQDHCSFASNHQGREPGEVVEVEGLDQILWPAHCVQDTVGADFVEVLATDRFDEVFRKGTDPRYDSYSGFYDNGHKKATGLTEYLREKGVGTVFVAGVATDYCVKFTVLDGCRDEFETFVVLDGCRGVINAAGDIEKAVAEMVECGASVVSSGMVGR